MKKLIFALIAGATAMGAAQAQGPYVGVGIASAGHTFNVPGATSMDKDGYKASGKLFGGFDIDPMFGVEAGYTRFGTSDASYLINNVPNSISSKGRALYVAGKATMPVNELVSVFGKLGVARTKNEVSSTTTGFNFDESDNGVYAGLGAQYNLSKQVALSLEYERYGKKKDFGAKADVITVAARYNF